MEEQQITASDDAVRAEAVNAEAVKTDESSRGGVRLQNLRTGL